MAALNINNAKSFLKNLVKLMPEHHPAKGEYRNLVRYLDEKCQGFVKVA
jgi:hypothetical protein